MKNSQKTTPLIQSPQKILLVLGLIFGLLFCIFIPNGAGFDEETHLVRIFDISGLNLIPNSGSYTFSEFFTLSYNRRFFQDPAWDQFDKQNISIKANWDSMSGGNTRSKYMPINYLPQAITAGIVWRVLDLPIVIGVITVRFAGFLFYLLLCYLTIRSLPTGKWIFLVLSLSPMALYQAATLNIDGFTMGVSFLFIGYLLKVFVDKESVIDAKKTWAIVFLTILVGCVKPGTILLLPLLLILVKNKAWSKWSFWLITGGVVISMVISLGWMSVFNTKTSIGTIENPIGDQLVLVINNLKEFIPMFFKGLIMSLGLYFRDWVGVYGYWVGKVPILTYVFFPIALILAYLAEPKHKMVSKFSRIFILVIALFCLVGIASYQFILHYRPDIQMTGNQGRYFLPFAPLLFLSLSGLVNLPERYRKFSGGLSALFLFLALCSYSFGMYRTFYTQCVYPVSAARPCTLPLYKNVDVNNPYVVHVNSSQQIIQSFTNQCSEITAIQLFVQSSNAEPTDKVIVSILDDNNHVLSENEALFSSLQNRATLKIPVQLNEIPEQTLLSLRVSLDSQDSPTADLGLLGRAGADIYPDGKLQINDVTQDGDLVFQYVCKYPFRK